MDNFCYGIDERADEGSVEKQTEDERSNGGKEEEIYFLEQIYNLVSFNKYHWKY